MNELKKLYDFLFEKGKYTKSFDEYACWLWKADILPVTSKQDFFGASIMEAVYCNTSPLLPKRLTYPELFDTKNNPQLFYEDFDDLVFKLECAINNISKIRNQKTQYLATDFDWKNMAPYYDNEYEILI